MKIFKAFSSTKKVIWDVLGSPKTVAALKLAAAVVGTIHAIEEFKEASKASKKQIGFKNEES